MILSCPACQKKYLIPDSAIGVDGRQVRCAACRHSWFEPAPEMMLGVADGLLPGAAAASVAPEPSVSSAVPPPSWSPPQSPPVDPPSIVREAATEPGYDPYAPEPPFQRRRNTSRYWTIAASLASVLLVGAIASVYYFASPNLLERFGLAIGEAESPLITQFTTDVGPKKGMPPVPRFVIVHGSITNPTKTTQRVPDLLAELVDSHGRPVYSWTITPERRTVAPGAMLHIDSTAVNVPMNASETHLSFLGNEPR